MASAKPAQVIEVFADVTCPFTHVGLASLAEQLRRRGPHVGIWVRSWPLEWVNGRPMDPHAAFEHAMELRDQVAPGSFKTLDASMFPPTTIPALALSVKAYKVGMDVGQALSFEVRNWLFEQGRNVADPDTLKELATKFDLDAPDPDDYATVVAEWKEGRERGVQGSPHFFCGGTNAFCPSMDISSNDDGSDMTIERTMGRLAEFLDGCLIPRD